MNHPPLAGFGVDNFKAFVSRQEVPLRPITLLFGKNNSGKSALLRSLVLGQEHFGHKPADKIADIGTYEQFRNAAEIPWVGLSYSFSAHQLPLSTFQRALVKNDITIRQSFRMVDNDTGDPSDEELAWGIEYPSQVTEYALSLAVDGNMLIPHLKQAATDSAWRNLLSRAWQDHVGREATGHELDTAMAILSNVLSEDYRPTEHVFHAKCNLSGLLFVRRGLIADLKDAFGTSSDAKPDQALLFLTRKMGLSSIKASDRRSYAVVKHLFEGLDGIAKCAMDALPGILDNQIYLGPLRAVPESVTASTANLAGGMPLWEEIISNDSALTTLNHWLQRLDGSESPPRLTVHHEGRLPALQAADLEHLRKALTKVAQRVQPSESRPAPEGGEADHTSSQTMSKEDMVAAWMEGLLEAHRGNSRLLPRLQTPEVKMPLPPSQVGIGLSQIIPILAAGAVARNRMILVEQPELHLHPAMQAELGDILIESSSGKSGNTWVIETHSEHVLLRLMRRIRETTRGTLKEGAPALRPEDVSLCFVERESGISRVHPIELDANGMLTRPWPGGFFEEGFREVMAW